MSNSVGAGRKIREIEVSTEIPRRKFLSTTAGVFAASTIPAWLYAAPEASPATRRLVVRTDNEIGKIRPELHGQFAEHLGSCIYGGIWVGKDSPIANINGFRKQVIEYLKELEVPVLRWPGGCFADDYHWQEGIGPVKQRPRRPNLNWGNVIDDNSFGTHEFIGLCRLIGAEPYLAGNVGSGSPTELREWLEYCNFPSGTTLSDLRASNGSVEPFHVRYWGVGNESWGCGGNMRPEYYGDLYRQFAIYLKTFGGTRPYLIASGPSGDDVRWTRGLLDTLQGGLPNGLSMHYYTGGEQVATKFDVDHMKKQLSIFARVEQSIVHQREVINGYQRGDRVGLILDEWGVWDQIPHEDEVKRGQLWQQSTMRSGVAAGLGLNLFNRQADKLFMCNIAQMVNVLQSLLITDGPEVLCVSAIQGSPSQDGRACRDR
jgi:alpha-N-arabinofuranosidase